MSIDEIIKAAAADIMETMGGDLRIQRRDELRSILRRHFAGLEAEQWRPIETAPKDGTPILLWNPTWYQDKGGMCVGLWSTVSPAGWYAVEHAMHIDPTHWRPLPPPPKEADDD